MSRAVLLAATGVLAPEAMHSCDTPACVEREHLSWGTRQENSADCWSKGRGPNFHRPQHGEQNGRAILTTARRAEFLDRVRNGEPAGRIAPEFGISKSHAGNLAREAGIARPIGRPRCPSDTPDV